MHQSRPVIFRRWVGVKSTKSGLSFPAQSPLCRARVYLFLTNNVYTADTLHHAVIFTVYPHDLDLAVCRLPQGHVSAVKTLRVRNE